MRIGFAEIDPPAGSEPSDDLVEQAARRCCDNPFYAFHKPPGTSLICIQGDWSNVVDAKIKGRLATAMGVDSRSPYSPLYARAVGAPKPWGVTALFAEYTGNHPPLELDWTLERGVRTSASYQRPESEPVPAGQSLVISESPEPPAEREVEQPLAESPRDRVFATFWEFAVAVNRADPAALALATNGATSAFPVDGAEVRKLLTTMWFRTVLARLSRDWRDRLLNVLIEYAPVSDHPVKFGRHTRNLRELTYEQLQEINSTDVGAGCRSTRPGSADHGRPVLGSGCGEAVTLRRGTRAGSAAKGRRPDRQVPGLIETEARQLFGRARHFDEQRLVIGHVNRVTDLEILKWLRIVHVERDDTSLRFHDREGRHL